MGMFDELTCKHESVLKRYRGFVWQTKDLKENLDSYRITKPGNFLRRGTGERRFAPTVFSGVVRFYRHKYDSVGICGKPGFIGSHGLVEYEAEIEGGRVKSIKLVEDSDS